jgi:FdhD protein
LSRIHGQQLSKLVHCLIDFTVNTAAIVSQHIFRVTENTVEPAEDILAVEEPLTIRIGQEGHIPEDLTMTMRTPGHDVELVTGLLITEQIITSASEVISIDLRQADNGTIAEVILRQDVSVDVGRVGRTFYSSSSCGVCGKASADKLQKVTALTTSEVQRIDSQVLYQLPRIMRRAQSAFQSTGGLHAVGLFEADKLLLLMEDIGRHNAMDKIIGAAAKQKLLPLHQQMAVLSGRASYELLTKAVIAQIPVVAAVGAPSNFAVSVAQENNVTLIGFLSDERFNIYTHPERILLSQP